MSRARLRARAIAKQDQVQSCSLDQMATLVSNQIFQLGKSSHSEYQEKQDAPFILLVFQMLFNMYNLGFEKDELSQV